MLSKDSFDWSQFVHLHNHTHYSLLDGLQKVDKMLERARELEMAAVAITDHGTLCGAIDFYIEAEKRSIKPIIGVEFYQARQSHLNSGTEERNPYHLLVIAYNNQGYHNLMQLSSISQTKGYYYKPRIDKELLQQYAEGLIVLSGCLGSELSQLISAGRLEDAKQLIIWYRDYFSQLHQDQSFPKYYLELQDHHDYPEQKALNDQLIEFSKELNVPLVITKDCHYTHHQDQQAHEVLLCVQTNAKLSDSKRMSLKDIDLHFASANEIISHYQDSEQLPYIKEAMANTAMIADKVKVKIELDKILIPKFPVPVNLDETKYLQQLVWIGIAERYQIKFDFNSENKHHLICPQKVINDIVLVVQNSYPEVYQRTMYELAVINKMGFDGYMLMVGDLIRFAKNSGIVCGPGRGSAAGSIVAYALGITTLDPLKYDLLFERFLNPDRISMPDIDMDFADNRREEVISYAKEKYGEDRVAQIVTFGTMAARNALRDTGRVLGYDYAEIDILAKQIPPPIQGRHTSLAVHLEQIKALQESYNSSSNKKELFDIAVSLEGTIRNTSVHAAGVVIAPDVITKYTPIMRAVKGGYSTQYAMGPIEKIGLLKMDFLGLSNLTIIDNALKNIAKDLGEIINIDDIPFDDPKTYHLLRDGDTIGVFQFESSGMRKYIKQLQPTVFEDLVAMGALYRPGPLSAGYTDQFVNRKNNADLISYPHPKMNEVLKNTYGVIVYQEQVMKIATDFCGLSGSEADTLRKAIGKKQPETLAKMKKVFVEGGINHSQVDRDFMETFWEQLLGFAAYCFNKSHSACYALISYQTAYLKANYFSCFMASLMTSDSDNIDRIAIEVSECANHQVKVIGPDINIAIVDFSVSPDNHQDIIFGLKAIKNVGEKAMENIITARDLPQRKPFASLEDFIIRVSPEVINKKYLESLFKVGAFDRLMIENGYLGDIRELLLSNLDHIINVGLKFKKSSNLNQSNLFGELIDQPILDLALPKQMAEKINFKKHLQYEKELLGIYLSASPLSEFKDWILANKLGLDKQYEQGQVINLVGQITKDKVITTKNNQSMAFLEVESLEGSIEVIVFPKAYQQLQDLLTPDQIVFISGSIDKLDKNRQLSDQTKLILEKLYLVSREKIEAGFFAELITKSPNSNFKKNKVQQAPALLQRELVIVVDHQIGSNSLEKIKEILETSAIGDMPVSLLVQGGDRINLPYRINIDFDTSQIARLDSVIDLQLLDLVE